MSPIRALLLGLLQGIAAAFPVSSSGHVRLVAELLGQGSGAVLSMMALLHLGTLIAVGFVFYRDILRMGLAIGGLFRDLAGRILSAGRRKKAKQPLLADGYRRLAVFLLLALVPTFVLGRVLAQAAQRSTSMLLVTAIGFFLTALMLLVSSFFAGSRGLRRMGFADALLIGVFHGVSVFSGISRLGMALSAANLCGISRKTALRFAYLLGIPTILGALSVELAGGKAALPAGTTVPACVLGVIGSAVGGILILRFAVRLLRRKNDRVFAVYCFAIGIVTVAVYLLGR